MNLKHSLIKARGSLYSCWPPGPFGFNIQCHSCPWPPDASLDRGSDGTSLLMCLEDFLEMCAPGTFGASAWMVKRTPAGSDEPGF